MTLEQFIAKAKLSSYADENRRFETGPEDGSKEIWVRESQFQYRDRYFGWNPFAGQEVVWADGDVIWAMNYYGSITDDSTHPDSIYAFLRSALRRIEVARPYRGPERMIEGLFEYFDESIGTISRFRGTERIMFSGREVYSLEYHGGGVRNRRSENRE